MFNCDRSSSLERYKKTELKPGMIFNDWSRMFYNIFIQKVYLLWNRSGAKTRARAGKFGGCANFTVFKRTLLWG